MRTINPSAEGATLRCSLAKIGQYSPNNSLTPASKINEARNTMENDSLNRNEKISAIKLHTSQYVVALVLLMLGCGLWRLQVLGSDNYRVLAEQNRIHKVPVLAPRGRIFDREGRIMVDNYPSVTCFLLRDQQRNIDADLPLIAEGLHLPIEEIQSDIRHSNA